MTIYNWIVTVSWLIFLGYWIVSAISSKKSAVRGNRQTFIVRIIIIIIVVAFFKSGAFNYVDVQYFTGTSNTLISAIGAVLCAVGVAFAIWARMHLGKNWGMPMAVQRGAELVTSGPYAYVRNPIYSGSLLGMFGTALVSGYGWFILFAVVTAYFIYSAKTEEKLMMEQFPNTYPAYKKRTRMIIPFVL